MKTLMDELFPTDEDKRSLEQERVILSATELVCEIMENKKVNDEELAQRLNMTKNDIVDFFEGNELDIRVLVNVLWVLGFRLNLKITEKG